MPIELNDLLAEEARLERALTGVRQHINALRGGDKEVRFPPTRFRIWEAVEVILREDGEMREDEVIKKLEEGGNFVGRLHGPKNARKSIRQSIKQGKIIESKDGTLRLPKSGKWAMAAR